MDLAEFTSRKEELESLRSQIARKEGVLDQLLTGLREEFGLESLEDARTRAERLEEKALKWEVEYETLLAQFLEEFGDNFDE